jgi:hypothetical protein
MSGFDPGFDARRRLAGERSLVVRHGGEVVKRLPLRGLRRERLPFERYCAVMGKRRAPRLGTGRWAVLSRRAA